MKAFLLLFLSVSCSGMKWNEINKFKEIFEEYSNAALQTISTIESTVNTSKTESEEFMRDVYLKSIPLIFPIPPNDICYNKILNEQNIAASIQIQVFQLQIPLVNRITDIRERLHDINAKISLYQNLADHRFWSCQAFNRSCTEETNQWLVSSIYSLSCNLRPNCNNHSIKKRSVCSKGQFRCNDDYCIDGYYYCNGDCHCDGCTDEPPECQRNCDEFRCEETFRCISTTKKCDGKDDCGDDSDEQNCPTTTTTPRPSYYHGNCSIDAGDFLCSPNKCIKIEQVCDGFNDCDDGSDEGELCKDRQCSPDCSKRRGVCLSGPKGPQCLYECPPGMFETSAGCSLRPEAPLPTLAQVIDDTPRLLSRHSARYNYLKMKTIEEISKSMREFVRCKREEFTLLSKVVRFSSVETWPASGSNAVDQLTSSNPPIIGNEPNNLSSVEVTDNYTFQSSTTTDATTVTDPAFY